MRRVVYFFRLRRLEACATISSNNGAIKSKRIGRTQYVTRTGETRGAYRVLVGRPGGNRPLGRPRRRGKGIPIQAWTGPQSSRRFRFSGFQENRHMKVVRLSAQRTGRLYPVGIIPGTNFCQRLSQPHGHSAAGRIVSTRDLPACIAVPQPTAQPRTPLDVRRKIILKWILQKFDGVGPSTIVIWLGIKTTGGVLRTW